MHVHMLHTDGYGLEGHGKVFYLGNLLCPWGMVTNLLIVERSKGVDF